MKIKQLKVIYWYCALWS